MRPAGPGETGISRSIILIRWRASRVTQPVLLLSPVQILPQRRRLAGALEIASPRRAQTAAREQAELDEIGGLMGTAALAGDTR